MSELKEKIKKIPLLKTSAGPRDGEQWVQRLKEEYESLITYVEANKEADAHWFNLESNAAGTRWFGTVWYYHEQVKYEFDLEFDIPVTYPQNPPELALPQLDGKTLKMYRGGKICLTVHFHPLWTRNVPKFGIAHAMALGMGPWLAAEVPHMVREGPMDDDSPAGCRVSLESTREQHYNEERDESPKRGTEGYLPETAWRERAELIKGVRAAGDAFSRPCMAAPQANHIPDGLNIYDPAAVQKYVERALGPLKPIVMEHREGEELEIEKENLIKETREAKATQQRLRGQLEAVRATLRDLTIEKRTSDKRFQHMLQQAELAKDEVARDAHDAVAYELEIREKLEHFRHRNAELRDLALEKRQRKKEREKHRLMKRRNVVN